MTEELTLSWIKALKYSETRPSLLTQLENHLCALNQDLPVEDHPGEQAIRNVLEKFKTWDPDVERMFRGEIAEIVDQDDTVCTHTEVGVAHLLGLRHRTANAFVLSPTGKIVCQRRAHNKRFGLYLSIYGGHVKMPQTYEDAMRAELEEELRLGRPPQGKMQIIGKDLYNVPGDLNVEFRALFLYWLTKSEYELIQKNQEDLDSIKLKLTRAEFEDWLKLEQNSQDGDGEVWSVYEIGVRQLIGADCEEVFVRELKRTIDLHYLMVGDRFQGQQSVVDEKAFFTPDLLDLVIQNPAICQGLLAAAGDSQ